MKLRIPSQSPDTTVPRGPRVYWQPLKITTRASTYRMARSWAQTTALSVPSSSRFTSHKCSQTSRTSYSSSKLLNRRFSRHRRRSTPHRHPHHQSTRHHRRDHNVVGRPKLRRHQHQNLELRAPILNNKVHRPTTAPQASTNRAARATTRVAVAAMSDRRKSKAGVHNMSPISMLTRDDERKHTTYICANPIKIIWNRN